MLKVSNRKDKVFKNGSSKTCGRKTSKNEVISLQKF